MTNRHFDSYLTKLMTSVDEHIDDVRIFKELKEECIILLEEFRNESHNGYDTLRSLMYFNVEVKQMLNVIMVKKKVADHHSVFALQFIASILDVEIDILKEIIQSNSGVEIAGRQKQKGKLYKWTGGRREIVEVIEAILLLGSINDGDVTKSEFFKFIGRILNVDLSHHNKILNDILNRKDDFEIDDKRIRYLPMMYRALSKKLHQLDCKRK